MSGSTATLHLANPDRTCAVAQALAACLDPGDTILLSGQIGAGKSHFSRCLILASLDTPEDVPSPTYTLVQSYPGRRGEIWHADLYRLGDISELEELGLIDAFSDAICLVEWPDKLGDAAPASALSVTLEAPARDDTRIMHLSWTAPRWADKLKGILDERP